MSAQNVAVKQPPKQVELACHHVALYNAPYPKHNDIVYCRRCADYRTVVGQWFQFYNLCNRCRLNLSYGRDMNAARVGARKHLARYPTHTVSIRRALEVVEVVTWQGIQPTLPEPDN